MKTIPGGTMMTKARPKKKAAKKKAPAKRSGVVPDLKAAAEPLSIYAGNSARVDEARDAYERAEAWAKAPAGTPYGARSRTATTATRSAVKR